MIDHLNPQNRAILELLEKWSKEPPIEDDEWWDNFELELKEIRKTGWKSQND